MHCCISSLFIVFAEARACKVRKTCNSKFVQNNFSVIKLQNKLQFVFNEN